jgi:dolichol-phosphate mannosyltransferase
MDKIVIVMPTYKEKDNIARMIPELFEKEFPGIRGANMHLLVVNDLPAGGRDDGTGDIVRKFKVKFKNLHLLEDAKQGLGWAYVRGMRYAVDKLHADATIEMDADFQHPPRFVRPMVEAYLAGADYVIGSRYIKGGSVPGEWAMHRRAVSFFGNLFIRIVLVKPTIHDLTTGFRLTRVRGVLDKIKLEKLMELTRFAYKVDLMYQSIKNAKKIVEVPLEFAPRTEEVSKFSMQEMISTFKVAIILGIKDKQRFIKYGAVGFIGYAINAIGLEAFYRLGFSTGVAAAIGAEFSNFVLNNFWTFKEEKITSLGRIISKFIQFNLSSAGAIVIQAVVVGAGTAIFGAQTRQIMLIIAVGFFVIPYNYAMYNLFIWKTWKVPALAKIQKRLG